jgi:hypothetical protein
MEMATYEERDDYCDRQKERSLALSYLSPRAIQVYRLPISPTTSPIDLEDYLSRFKDEQQWREEQLRKQRDDFERQTEEFKRNIHALKSSMPKVPNIRWNPDSRDWDYVE